MRFINNADPKFTNCYVKNLLCNTVHRIGLYASMNIKPGTEMFFHYGYKKEQTKEFKQPRRPAKEDTKTSKVVPDKSRIEPVSSPSSSSSISRGHRDASSPAPDTSARKRARSSERDRAEPSSFVGTTQRSRKTAPRNSLRSVPSRGIGQSDGEYLSKEGESQHTYVFAHAPTCLFSQESCDNSTAITCTGLQKL